MNLYSELIRSQDPKCHRFWASLVRKGVGDRQPQYGRPRSAAASSRIDPVVLFFCGGAFFVWYLRQTVLGVIEPSVQADLGLSPSEGQWVVNVFFLTLALCVAPGGRLGDYYGHRNVPLVPLVALAVFSLGSLSAAVADDFTWLLVSLGVAGMGASTLYPSSAPLVANSASAETRGHVLGQYSAIGVTVFALGPVMAGLLTEAASWRLVFALQRASGPGSSNAGSGTRDRWASR
jgi:MFS family permease